MINSKRQNVYTVQCQQVNFHKGKFRNISTFVEKICTYLCWEICDTTIGGQNVHVRVHRHGHGHGNGAYYIFITFDISIRHYSNIMSHSAVITCDLLSIIYLSIWCPIRRFLLSTFCPFVIVYHSTFCPFLLFNVFSVDLLSHSMLHPSMFFTVGVFYFNILSVNRRLLTFLSWSWHSCPTKALRKNLF